MALQSGTPRNRVLGTAAQRHGHPGLSASQARSIPRSNTTTGLSPPVSKHMRPAAVGPSNCTPGPLAGGRRAHWRFRAKTIRPIRHSRISSSSPLCISSTVISRPVLCSARASPRSDRAPLSPFAGVMSFVSFSRFVSFSNLAPDSPVGPARSAATQRLGAMGGFGDRPLV